MKTAEQICQARKILNDRIASATKEKNLNPERYAVLCGMLNSLVWVMDGQNCSTLERILAGEPFVPLPKTERNAP